MTRPWTCIAVGAYLLARACAQVSDDVVTSADYYYDYDSVEEPPEPARAPEASPVAPSPEPPIPPPPPPSPVVTPPPLPPPLPGALPPPEPSSPPESSIQPSSPPPPPESPARPPRPPTQPQVLKYPPEKLASVDDPSYRPGDWLLGRSTYFDAPASWKAKFAPHLFGDLHGNGCGSFTNKGPGLESNDNFTLPLDQAAAIADFDPRFYEGACGTCFEIGCITGPILDVATPENQTKLPLEAGGSTSGRSFYDVDKNALDSYNRTVPGENVLVDPVSGVEWEYTRCWNESRTIYVTIVDVCPCQYSWGTQSICCGPVPHFDLSYWAHEHLAHPTQGKMMLRFRPVNCDTKEPVDARRGASARMGVADVEEKGRRLSMLNGGGDGQRVFVNNASAAPVPRTVPVYRDAISPGWSFNAYKDQWAEISKLGHGAGGSAALCVSVSPGGRMALRCTNCQDTVKPFARVSKIDLWVRSTCATEPRYEPPVYLGVSTTSVYDYALGSTPAEAPCGNKTRVWDHVTGETRRDNCGWRISVPIAALRGCTPAKAAAANSIFLELGRGSPGDAKVCMDEASIAT